MSNDIFVERLCWVIKESEYKNIARLARKMDIDRKAIDKWTKGTSSPSASHLVNLCNILSISPEWLLCGIGKPYLAAGTEFIMDQEEFAQRLAELVEKSEIKYISQIARKLDVDRKSLVSWMKGASLPTAGHIARICNLFKISVVWLLCGTGKEPTYEK